MPICSVIFDQCGIAPTTLPLAFGRGSDWDRHNREGQANKASYSRFRRKEVVLAVDDCVREKLVNVRTYTKEEVARTENRRPLQMKVCNSCESKAS